MYKMLRDELLGKNLVSCLSSHARAMQALQDCAVIFNTFATKPQLLKELAKQGELIISHPEDLYLNRLCTSP